MFRFTIRDLLWFMVLVGLACGWLATAHRSALMEARLQAAERQVAACIMSSELLAAQNQTDRGTFESLWKAVLRMSPTEDQLNTVRDLFKEELKSRGIEIEITVD